MYRRKILILIMVLCGIFCNADDGSLVIDNEEPVKFVIGDDMFSPSAEVYDDWNNYRVHTFVSNVPEEYEIDMSEYHHPLHNNNELISPFGKRLSGTHKGVDIRATLQDTVYAAFDGKVRYAAYNAGGYGYLVVVRHYNGLETYYAHLSRINVTQNQFVIAGEALGTAGRTGRASCVHLHFETRFCGVPINPEEIISIEKGIVLDDIYKFKKKSKKK